MSEDPVPKLVVVDRPERHQIDELCGRLDTHNDRLAPQLTRSDVFVGAYEADGALCGGLLGTAMGGWMFIDALWVVTERRGTGLGRALMLAGEEVARDRGCRGAFTDTFSFQAPGFYERLGYETFGQLDDYDGDQTRYFMRKRL